MSLTITSGTKKPWQLDLKKLRHRYYAQLTPDRQHLVPGMLHQGTPPTIGQWLQVGAITQELAERYFVQQTGINTLVPGLLIQNPTPPGSTWKDVRKFTSFYYVDSDVSYDLLEITVETGIAGSLDLIIVFINPVLDEIYPDRDPDVSITMQLFYYYGNTNGLENDMANLVRVTEDTAIRFYTMETETITDVIHTTEEEEAYFTMQPDADDGYYSIILGVQNPAGEITDYIVLQHIIHKFVPG